MLFVQYGGHQGVQEVSAQNGVLQNVEYAGVVPGQGPEGNGKGLVLLRPLHPAQLQAGFFVDHFIQGAVQLRQGHHPLHRKAVELLVLVHNFLLKCVLLLYVSIVAEIRQKATNLLA